MLEFHPEAAANIDQRGLKLLAAVSKQNHERAPDVFPTQQPIAATITEKDIIGEIGIGTIDITGKNVARTFASPDGLFGLAGEDHANLRRLAESVLKDRRFASAVGPDFVEQEIFDWCRDRYRQTASNSLSEQLTARINESVKDLTIWIPIANLEIQTAFGIGTVKFDTLSPAQISEWEQRSPPQSDHAIAIRVRELFDGYRAKLGGRAVAIVTLSAEADHALEVALDLADTAVSFLRFFHIASVTPWKTCVIGIKGSEYLPMTEAFLFHGGGNFTHTSGIRGEKSTPWRLSTAELSQIRLAGFDVVDGLLDEGKLTPFKHRLRKSIITYSKGVAAHDLNDRLVYSCSALEGLLLKDGSEPIQDRLSDRIAFMTSKDGNERRLTARIVKEAYSLRSGYVHHMATIEEERTLEGFIPLAWRVICQAILNAETYNTPVDFIDAIDKVKYGG